MQYEIYIDQFFVEQLLYGFWLIELSLTASRQKGVLRKVLAADALYAVLQCAYAVTGMQLLALAGVLPVLFLAFPPGGRARGGICFLLASFCLGGTLSALLAVLPLGLEAGAFAAFLLLRTLWERTCRRRREWEHRAEVSLYWGERQASFRALVDTGNHLREPLTGQPVSILDEESAAAFLGEGWEGQRGFYLVPYHSIGRMRGWMRAVAVDKMCVMTPDGREEVQRPLFAISNGKVSLGGRYQVILNPEQIDV